MYALSPLVLHLLQVVGLLPVGLEGMPLQRLVASVSISRRIYSLLLALGDCIGFYQWVEQLTFVETAEMSSFWGSLSTSTMVTVVLCTSFTNSLATFMCLMVAVFRVDKKIQLLESLREVEFLLWSRGCSHKTRIVTYLALANTAVASLYTICKNVFDYTAYDSFFVVCKVIIICGVIEWAELVLSIKDRFQLVNSRIEEVVARSRSKQLLWTPTLPCVEGFTMHQEMSMSVTKFNEKHWKLCHIVYDSNDVYGCQLVFTMFFLFLHQSFFSVPLVPQEMSLSVTDLSEIHWKLCRIVYDTNDIYGCQLVFTMFFLFSHLICHPYFFFLLVFNDRFIDDFSSLAVFMDWLLIYITTLFMMMWPCSSAVSEAKRTVAVVTKLMGSSSGRPIFKQLDAFAQQLIHRDVEFSACGLFTLQSSIIVTVASAVTTYMAIIIQFQISAEGEDDDDDDDEATLPS